jgi:hypothetical protein
LSIQHLAVPLQRFARIFCRIYFRALAAAPEDVNTRAQFRTEVHRAHSLLQGIQPHARIVCRERTILENRIVKKIGSGHRHFHTAVVERVLKLAHDAIPLGWGRIDRHQIVVVQIYAVSTQLAQAFDNRDGTKTRTRRVAKRVASTIADGP